MKSNSILVYALKALPTTILVFLAGLFIASLFFVDSNKSVTPVPHSPPRIVSTASERHVEDEIKKLDALLREREALLLEEDERRKLEASPREEVEPRVMPPQLRGSNSTDSEPKSIESDVENALRSMLDAVIAYNVPEKPINIDSSHQIQLLLDLNRTVEELKQYILKQGEREGAEVKVSRIMEATLSGDKFSITSITPDIQAISESMPTEWRWEITPKIEGKHNLHLTLVALLDINGRPTARSIKTFDRVIEVEVTGIQKITAFVSNNWQWLWATILVPVAGWIWKQRKNKSQ
ncbi:hypothetical protein MTR11_06045 [Vibrio sp. CCB-PB317]|uniref:hypothetical protein n=1 Tax=Vibrio sp. CCB-PB317 TaxID=2929171 RepID=UPI001FAD48F7|nr:hypothetical protein [Vibrio sp. CCB-PB317]MCJ0881237.1 hypothetical protein [Vibrio sp. CCB-PB317]